MFWNRALVSEYYYCIAPAVTERSKLIIFMPTVKMLCKHVVWQIGCNTNFSSREITFFVSVMSTVGAKNAISFNAAKVFVCGGRACFVVTDHRQLAPVGS